MKNIITPAQILAFFWHINIGKAQRKVSRW